MSEKLKGLWYCSGNIMKPAILVAYFILDAARMHVEPP